MDKACKQGVCKWGILKHPVFNILNFRGWIQLIFDKITLIYCDKNAFNPTSKVQNIENGVFQNAPGVFQTVITVAFAPYLALQK